MHLHFRGVSDEVLDATPWWVNAQENHIHGKPAEHGYLGQGEA